MKTLAPFLLALLPLQAAAAGNDSRPELVAAPVPAAQHAEQMPWLDSALRRARKTSDRLHAERGTRAQVLDHEVVLKWPARKAINVRAYEVQYISMYVDQDPGGGILDWNCGERTYDGHNGTDIGIGPYSWYGMRNNQGIATAAAPGIILDIDDSFPEESCDTNDKDGNYVIVEHDDGSWGVYAHIRTGSATRKPVGERVYTGEYLGVIGSSGISSGPHLHFGVGFWEQVGNTQEFVAQDPWTGACDDIGGGQWWEEAPSALYPFVMDVSTHSGAPTQPACPQSEDPKFKSQFQSGDPIFVNFVVHDWPQGESVVARIRRPDNSVFIQTQPSTATEDRLRAWTLGFGTNLPGNAPSGEWKVETDFMGDTYNRSFWVNVAQPQPVPPVVADNAYNGLWYDNTKSGEGYNIITSPSGTVIFFYGSDEDGNRLWLISQTVPGSFQLGQEREILMYESTGGAWDSPIPSGRGLSEWGFLRLNFSACNAGTAFLRGQDGEKTSILTKLAAVPGTNCSTGARGDNRRSGLWYDPALTGEGFNFIVAPNGVIVFYYGFDADGNRLWMHSNTITDVFSVGADIDAVMKRAGSGQFNTPVANALEDWGTINVKVNACNDMTITMESMEGDKTSHGVPLAQVLGLTCQ